MLTADSQATILAEQAPQRSLSSSADNARPAAGAGHGFAPVDLERQADVLMALIDRLADCEQIILNADALPQRESRWRVAADLARLERETIEERAAGLIAAATRARSYTPADLRAKARMLFATEARWPALAMSLAGDLLSEPVRLA